jgi:hypothetical protein
MDTAEMGGNMNPAGADVAITDTTLLALATQPAAPARPRRPVRPLGLLGLDSLIVSPWTGVVLILVAGTGVA